VRDLVTDDRISIASQFIFEFVGTGGEQRGLCDAADVALVPVGAGVASLLSGGAIAVADLEVG
jgi:hypothetical protein